MDVHILFGALETHPRVYVLMFRGRGVVSLDNLSSLAKLGLN